MKHEEQYPTQNSTDSEGQTDSYASDVSTVLNSQESTASSTNESQTPQPLQRTYAIHPNYPDFCRGLPVSQVAVLMAQHGAIRHKKIVDDKKTTLIRRATI